MSAVNISKHAAKFLWAIDKCVKTEVRKTEEEYETIALSILRPLIRNVVSGEREPDQSFEQTELGGIVEEAKLNEMDAVSNLPDGDDGDFPEGDPDDEPPVDEPPPEIADDDIPDFM